MTICARNFVTEVVCVGGVTGWGGSLVAFLICTAFSLYFHTSYILPALAIAGTVTLSFAILGILMRKEKIALSTGALAGVFQFGLLLLCFTSVHGLSSSTIWHLYPWMAGGLAGVSVQLCFAFGILIQGHACGHLNRTYLSSKLTRYRSSSSPSSSCAPRRCSASSPFA